jgi:aromatic ring-opening dioxygenase catalytic subunit (LigB family)
MAEIVLVETCSHSPFLFTEPHLWNEIRSKRPTSEQNPVTTEEENAAQWERTQNAWAVLRGKIEDAKPDVILVFGDDQIEQFDFSNFPGFAVFVGDEYEGYRTFPRGGIVPGQRGDFLEKTPENWVRVKSQPDLAKELAVGLVQRDFDLSFMTEEANKHHGIGHAFLRPMSNLVPDYHIPVLPFYVNCFYGPQPSANRCYQLGRAIREIIDNSELDLRIAILGSGGLWHTPGNPEAWLNTEFDEQTLTYVRAGDAQGLAKHFDDYGREKPANYGPDTVKWIDGATDMYNGLGSGTGETRNWIVASAIVDGVPGTVVDYVPVYASPCGMGFAYWDMS